MGQDEEQGADGGGCRGAGFGGALRHKTAGTGLSVWSGHRMAAGIWRNVSLWGDGGPASCHCGHEGGYAK